MSLIIAPLRPTETQGTAAKPKSAPLARGGRGQCPWSSSSQEDRPSPQHETQQHMWLPTPQTRAVLGFLITSSHCICIWSVGLFRNMLSCWC